MKPPGSREMSLADVKLKMERIQAAAAKTNNGAAVDAPVPDSDPYQPPDGGKKSPWRSAQRLRVLAKLSHAAHGSSQAEGTTPAQSQLDETAANSDRSNHDGGADDSHRTPLPRSAADTTNLSNVSIGSRDEGMSTNSDRSSQQPTRSRRGSLAALSALDAAGDGPLGMMSADKKKQQAEAAAASANNKQRRFSLGPLGDERPGSSSVGPQQQQQQQGADGAYSGAGQQQIPALLATIRELKQKTASLEGELASSRNLAADWETKCHAAEDRAVDLERRLGAANREVARLVQGKPGGNGSNAGEASKTAKPETPDEQPLQGASDQSARSRRLSERMGSQPRATMNTTECQTTDELLQGLFPGNQPPDHQQITSQGGALKDSSGGTATVGGSLEARTTISTAGADPNDRSKLQVETLREQLFIVQQHFTTELSRREKAAAEAEVEHRAAAQTQQEHVASLEETVQQLHKDLDVETRERQYVERHLSKVQEALDRTNEAFHAANRRHAAFASSSMTSRSALSAGQPMPLQSFSDSMRSRGALQSIGTSFTSVTTDGAAYADVAALPRNDLT